MGNSCSLGRTCVLFVFSIFVILDISSFGFQGWIWILNLIASVPGLCILFTYNRDNGVYSFLIAYLLKNYSKCFDEVSDRCPLGYLS